MLVLLASGEQGRYLGFSPYWLLAPTGFCYAKVWQLRCLGLQEAEHEQQRLLAFGEQVLALLAYGEQGQQEFWSADGAWSKRQQDLRSAYGELELRSSCPGAWRMRRA